MNSVIEEKMEEKPNELTGALLEKTYSSVQIENAIQTEKQLGLDDNCAFLDDSE